MYVIQHLAYRLFAICASIANLAEDLKALEFDVTSGIHMYINI